MTTDALCFQGYAEWREALTKHCGVSLTPDYARKRIQALRDPKDPATRKFIDTYGEAHLQQVIRWFQQAEQEM